MSSQGANDGPEAEPAVVESSVGQTLPAIRRGGKRDHRLRAALIEKLPKLSFASWSAKEDFKIDEEWAGIVSLRSDAVLGPLEPLAPEPRDG